MRNVLAAGLAVAVTAALALGGTALAGNCELECPNACPLAKGANEFRSGGAEAEASDAIVRTDERRAVLAVLDRV